METLTVFFDILTRCDCTTELNAKLFASVQFSVSRNVGNHQSTLRNISENLRSQSCWKFAFRYGYIFYLLTFCGLCIVIYLR